MAKKHLTKRKTRFEAIDPTIEFFFRHLVVHVVLPAIHSAHFIFAPCEKITQDLYNSWQIKHSNCRISWQLCVLWHKNTFCWFCSNLACGQCTLSPFVHSIKHLWRWPRSCVWGWWRAENKRVTTTTGHTKSPQHNRTESITIYGVPWRRSQIPFTK